MQVTNATTARQFVAAWGDRPAAASHIGLALEGLHAVDGIIWNSSRHSTDWKLDNREAIGVLRSAFFRLTGRAWVR